MARGCVSSHSEPMHIERSLILDAPLETVWKVLGTRFHDAGAWATNIALCGPTDEIGPVGVANRVCEIASMGRIIERVDLFDVEHHTFAFTVVEGAPSMIRELKNQWWVRSVSADQTEVSFRIEAELSPFAELVMGWMMKRKMEALTDQACDDLRVYVETGVPSEAKILARARAA